MRIVNQIEFAGSFTSYKDGPERQLPEFAFIGRSNVGKSSLINMLSENDKIAKVSNTPGKTQTINYFLVNDSWYMVDLPGYGYAKVSKKLRANWGKMILDYLEFRPGLMLLFVLLDSRLPAQKLDIEFLQWCGSKGIPVSIVYTKTDKLTKNQLSSNLAQIRKTLLQDWEELPEQFVSSAVLKSGQKEILTHIESINSGISQS
jgi:GTP-binding protein